MVAVKPRRPPRLRLAWLIYILTLGLAGLLFWCLAIFDRKKFDAAAIVIGLGLSAVMAAGSWSELRRLRREAR